MRPPSYTHERELIVHGYTPIGVDEAGCGCLAGPVVAAAVHLPFDACHRGLCPLCGPSARQQAKPYGRHAARISDIRDSKLLSAMQRERLLAAFVARGFRWAIGVATHEEIDRVNIRNATYLAMRRAVETFLHSTSDTRAFALVDAWTIPGIMIPQRGIVHGDRLVKSIAAASIIAKVERDRMMGAWDREFPQYGFAQHKGYATPAHRAAIAQHGMSAIHRRSFSIAAVSVVRQPR